GGAFIGFKLPYRSVAQPSEIVVAHVNAAAGRDSAWQALPMTPAGSVPQGNPPGPTRVVMGPSGQALAFSDFGSGTGTLNLAREVGATGPIPGYTPFKPTYEYTVLNAIPRSDGGAMVLSKAQGSTNCLATILAPGGAGTEILNHLNVGNGV